MTELYRDKDDYAKAAPLFERSLVIFEKSVGPDHTYVAETLEDLAGLYRNTKHVAKAKKIGTEGGDDSRRKEMI